MSEKRNNITSDYLVSEALEAVKRLEREAVPGATAAARTIELENIRELILALVAEMGNLRDFSDRVTDRFNRMYFVMTAVWERLGYKKGTWEERLEQVRHWAREPERAMNRRILAAAGRLQPCQNGSEADEEKVSEEDGCGDRS